MRIAVDAMGGDFAPREIVAGALQAARDLPGIDKLYLVGREEDIRREIPGDSAPSCLEIVPAAEVVDMHDSPAAAVRRKRDSSIGRAVELVRDGKADAVFSAGSTGAAVAAAALKLRTLPGVLRPAIATVMPGDRQRPWVLLDAGATTDCTAAMLYQFAVMGLVYAREVLHIPDPAIGLMSIGGEESKGNEITKEAFALLKGSGLRFEGNVEGHDLFSGRVDVVVCDGFVGNVILKTSESVAHFIGHRIKEEFTRNPLRVLGALLVKPGMEAIKRQSDPSGYGGAPLLGVNGVCIIGHGASSAHAAFNGIRVAREAVLNRVNPLIVEGVGKAGVA